MSTLPTIIINPIAGRGRGAAAENEIRAAFQQSPHPVQILVTERPGDAKEWAYQAAQGGCPYIVGAGGDGTANEIVNGLARWVEEGGAPDHLPRLGMIPAGTGNDFVYSFSLKPRIDEACARIFQQNTQFMDVGLVESDTEDPLYFVNGVGLGFDAVVNIQSRKIRFLRGGAVFFPAVLYTMLFYYHAPRVAVSFNGHHFVDNLLMISVMNGERFGALFHMTPGSRIDDRRLSLCFVSRVSQPQMFALVPRFIKGTHPAHPKVKLADAGQVDLESADPLPAHVDGEIYSTSARQYRFSIAPWQLKMIC